MKQEYTIDELKRIAIELNSPEGDLRIARQAVISYMKENEFRAPGAGCPRCGNGIQMNISLDFAQDDPLGVFCPNCEYSGSLG